MISHLKGYIYSRKLCVRNLMWTWKREQKALCHMPASGYGNGVLLAHEDIKSFVRWCRWPWGT